MPTYPLTTLYCSDEDLAIRAGTDLESLIPGWQVVVEGIDGRLAAGSWDLTSAITDFEARGVVSGCIVDLWGNSGTAAADRFGTTSGTYWMAVESAVGHILTLRRLGLPAGVGEPPGAVQTITAVRFAVPTLRPQIERASRQLNHRYGIDAIRVGRGPGDLYDPDDLREACEALTLREIYLSKARQATDDVSKAKSEAFGQEFESALARLSVRFGPTGEDGPALTRVGRISR